MDRDTAVLTGAKQIIQRCLGLSKDQNLLIFTDETTTETASILSEAAEELDVPSTIIFVPISLQRRIPSAFDLSLLAQGAAREARAILTCVNSGPDCLAFRNRILETQWSARTRIGHMPGANQKVLKLANVDFNQLLANCHSLEIVLARGQTLELQSQAQDGTVHRLTADIGGFDRLPVASNGVIVDGVWGNVPSGETYIAPLEGSARGSVVINGSIPGLVVKPGNQIVLFFEQGRLKSIHPDDNRTAQFLQETQIHRAIAAGDENWRNLAEIGIGVNTAVDRLTGNMLYDEKAAKTAHIALGSNTFMGGKVDSSIHCDMVIKAPTIQVDGKTIVKKGRLHFVESEWREDHKQISMDRSPLQTAGFVARSGTEASLQFHLLARVLRPEPGRVSACWVGNEETSRLAFGIYNRLPGNGEWLEVHHLFNNGQDPDTVRRVLHLIWDYGLINYR